MSPRLPAPKRKVVLLRASAADLGRLGEDDERLERRAGALLSLLESGQVTGQPLSLLPSYGDLSDCRKIYFGVSAGLATHRIVYRDVPPANQRHAPVIEVVEVVAVEARSEGYAYLLASQRLGRGSVGAR